MKSTIIFVIFFLVFSSSHLSQVTITTTNYSQNFGTTNVPSWTNNSTYLGWYVNDNLEFQSELNITTTAPTNTGGVYVYRCDGGTDRKLGSRASSGTATIHYGLRIKNNTGLPIQSMTVSYKGFQLSLAENNNNSNVLQFSYKVVSSPSVIDNLTTTAGYTNVTVLNYVAPINHGGPGTSNQVSGIPCTTSSTITSCIPVMIQNNGEIMLRWTDVDNSANDHHMAIDEVQILFHFDNICATTLPIELIDFSGFNNVDHNLIKWSTGSENNNNFFQLHRSNDGKNWITINKVYGQGSTSHQVDYEYEDYDYNGGINYYKLTQTDFDGTTTEFHLIYIENTNKKLIIVGIYNILGQKVTMDYPGLKIVQYSNGTSIKILSNN